MFNLFSQKINEKSEICAPQKTIFIRNDKLKVNLPHNHIIISYRSFSIKKIEREKQTFNNETINSQKII